MDDEKDKRPPHKGLKKGLYVIPTLFTAANVAMGYLAVLSSIRGYQASTINAELAASYFNSAAIAIGLAILVVLFRSLRTINVDDLGSLKG